MRKPNSAGGRYFEYRSGLDGFVWEGMATKIDPGGSPPSRPRFIENARIQGGSIISRPDFIGPGGMVPAISLYDPAVADNTNAKNRLRFNITGSHQWDPHWAAEFNSVGGTRLWWGSTPGFVYTSPPAGSGWVQTDTGALFGFIDTDADPIFNRVGQYDSDDNWPPVIVKFNTEIYSGDFGCLRKIMLVQPPPGQQPANVLNTPADVIVLTFPGFRCTAMVEFMGRLWLVLTDPSNVVNFQIWSYDGFVSNLEYTGAVPAATGAAIAVFKNQLVVTVNGYANIVYRNAAGAWATATVGGYTGASPYLNSLAQYRDKLMIMNGVSKIYSWNGAALALEHTISGTNPETTLASVPAFAYCCMVLNDQFYYGWTDTQIIAPTLSTGGKIVYSPNIQPNAGNQIVIPVHATNGVAVTYTFVPLGTVANDYDVEIGATADQTWTNLKDCINKTNAYPTPGQNANGGRYKNSQVAHPLFSAAINTGTDTITLTTLIAGISGNLDGASPYPGYTNAQITTNVAGVVITAPTGGTGPTGEYVILGRYDADNKVADQWADFYTRNYSIYHWGANQILPPQTDGAITAMAFYRGRIWLAVSGVPNGNSVLMTHSIQYAPYDGWIECDDTNSGDPDAAGFGQYRWSKHGPGHQNDFGFIYNQIYYLKSI